MRPNRFRRASRRLGEAAIGALLGLCLLGVAGPARAQGTFTRSISSSFNGGSIVGGPHFDFPVLVDISDNDLRTISRGGSVAGYSSGRATVPLAGTTVTFTDPLPDDVGAGDRLVFTGAPAETLTISSRTGYYTVTLTGGAASAHTSQAFRIEGDDWAYDLAFRGDSVTCNAGSGCTLSHEIELYDGVNGRVVAWVLAPQVTGGGVVQLYYGNPSLVWPTETPAAVWDPGYVGVWHLNETGAGSLNEYADSTRYANHGQGGQGRPDAVPKRVAGKVGGGQRFDNLVDGIYDFIDVGQDASLKLTGTGITLEAWVYHNIVPGAAHGSPPSGSNPYGVLTSKGYYDGYRLLLQGNPFTCHSYGTLTDACFILGIPENQHAVTSSQYGAAPGADPLTTGQWHRIVGTYDGAEMKLYMDGPQLAPETYAGGHIIEPGTCCATNAGAVVTFSAPLTAGVAAGQVLTFRSGPNESLFIQSVDSPTQVTLTAVPAAAHAGQNYEITDPRHTGNIPAATAEQHVFIGQGDLPQDKQWSGQFEGDLDEVRISSTARSAAWIATEYNNQNNPGAFLPPGGPGAASLGIGTLTTHYRSIGSDADYTTGTVTVTNGSVMVTGTGTAWESNRRGKGDRIRIPCDDPPTCTGAVDYTIYSASDTQVRLTQLYTGTSGTYTHLIERKLSTPASWENCLDGPGGAGCEGVTGSSLIADNRAEVGVYYYEGGVLSSSPVVTFSGATTSPDHDITLTVNVAGRHRGISSGSPTWATFFNAAVSAAIQIRDDHVTVEWLDVYSGAPGLGHGIDILNVAPGNRITIRNMLLHDNGGDAIRIDDPDANVDVYNSFISGAPYGIRLSADLTPNARVNVYNNTLYDNDTAGFASRTTGGSYLRQTRPRVTLRNNIAHSNDVVDLEVSRTFDEAYFCTGMAGNDPTGCTDITAALADDTTNVALGFTTPATTECLYVGSNQLFRAFAASFVSGAAGGTDLQWDYWSGAAWTSLETGTFDDYSFQWDALAHWADDPPGWALRQGAAPAWPPAAGTGRYFVRACWAAGPASSPVEEFVARGDVSVASRYNLTTDRTSLSHSVWGGLGLFGLQDPAGTNVLFVGAPQNLHIQAGSMARNMVQDIVQGTGFETSSLTHRFILDVDAQTRPPSPGGDCVVPGATCWDLGADEFAPPTAVELMAFEVTPLDSAVDLAWATGSELGNLGFHLHRAPSANGPWERLTESLIPGLGSSPQGASYSWRDEELENGTRYFYRLEDVDTSAVSTFHGPVSAVPVPPPAPGESGAPPVPPPPGSGLPSPGEPPPGEPGGPLPGETVAECPDEGRCLYGSPGEPTLRVLSRSPLEMTVELDTPGFVASPDPAGVLVDVAGFASPTHADAVDLPFKRAVLDAIVGRRARLVSIEAEDELSWAALRPAAVAAPAVDSRPDGTVRALRQRIPLTTSALGVPRARLAGSAFMGHAKKLALELHPLRWDPAQGRLVLSQTLRVRIAFVGEDSQETGDGSLGRRNPRTRRTTPVVFAHLHTTERGLHAVPYDAVFPRAGRPLPLSALRLVRGGSVVPVHVEPPTSTFGPGSVLYFHVDRQAASTAFSSELSFALERTAGGVEMVRGPAEPLTGPLGSAPLHLARFETNRIYQSGLLQAPDVWLWDFAQSGMVKNVSLDLEGVDLASPLPARVRVFLQGASDAGVSGEHHVSFALNGVPLGETSFESMVPFLFEGTLPASALVEGTNTLTFTNVGDTGVVSRVFLDRVEVDYPETSALRAGRFSGAWTEEGVAEVGLGGGGGSLVTSFSSVFALDVTDPASPVWLSGLEPGPGSIRMQVEPGRRYQVLTPDGLLVPRVSHPIETGLRDTRNQADYVLVAPRAFLDAAQPLLLRRESQGLVTYAASLEDIAQDFGAGAPSAEAIRDFLAFAFHSWNPPSPRYVLLLGDASFDPRNFTGFDQGAPLPALWAKTSYLWTASDPAIAAVNGEDLLPDLALGRLPATNLQQAHALVQKVLDWEDAGYDLSGDVTLVADNPDLAGDFEADIADIEQSFLAPRDPQSLLVRTLGGATRPAILDAMNGGLSLLSYVGHGGAAVWASENVLNSFDPPALLAQPQQPFMLTMNCLNGYFVQPNLDALAEAFLKAEGRGTIAAFSPSGLSLDGPAHVFHRALVNEIVNGNHARLGDAVLAAQQAYALSGHMPELLGVYGLLGDPAMKVR